MRSRRRIVSPSRRDPNSDTSGSLASSSRSASGSGVRIRTRRDCFWAVLEGSSAGSSASKPSSTSCARLFPRAFSLNPFPSSDRYSRASPARRWLRARWMSDESGSGPMKASEEAGSSTGCADEVEAAGNKSSRSNESSTRMSSVVFAANPRTAPLPCPHRSLVDLLNLDWPISCSATPK